MTEQKAINFVMVVEISKEKNVKTPPSRVLVKESKTNSAATPSEEKQKDEVFNNQVVDFYSYSAKEKKKL